MSTPKILFEIFTQDCFQAFFRQSLFIDVVWLYSQVGMYLTLDILLLSGWAEQQLRQMKKRIGKSR